MSKKEKLRAMLDGFCGVFGFIFFEPADVIPAVKNPYQGFEADRKALRSDWEHAVDQFCEHVPHGPSLKPSARL